jgi:hypothetical protein
VDRCEEDVIIACGLYLLAEEEQRKKKLKYWIHKVFRAREEEGEFPTPFGLLIDDWQRFFKYFRMKLYNNQRSAQAFLFISLFTSALHVSGFL